MAITDVGSVMIGIWRKAALRAIDLRLLGACVLAACLSGAPAQAESRLALVIGNSSYRSVTALPNPVNDAKAVADELTAAGFDVTPALDLSQFDMRRAIRDFTAKVTDKGPDTVALVFYAGHGVQVDGENFLVPVDARIQREADIAIETVRLADLMSALAAVPSKMRIVILDACRNNPFAPTKQTRGLAIVDAPTGSIVAYSTAPGTEATDGAGANSPYTAAFLEVAKQPKLQIEQLFKQVRLKVHQATKGQQTPWESSSLTSDFWFLPIEDGSPAAVVAAAPAPDAAAVSRLPQQRPASTPSAPATAPVRPTPAGPTTFAATPPAAAYAPPPRVSQVADIRTLPPDQAYDLVIAEDSVEAYEEFLLVYPSDPRAEWVRTSLALRVDAIAWRYASVLNTPAAYEAYVARYPGGAYADEAVRLKVRPRMRIIDSIIAPRVVVAPPAPRIALPLLQTRRPPGVPIALPVVLSRPASVPAAGLAPAQRLPAVNPAGAARINAVPAAPGQLPRPALPPLPGPPRQNVVNTAPAQNVVPPNKLPNANAPLAVPPRPSAINAPPGPNASPQYRAPGPNAVAPGPSGPLRQNNAINVPPGPNPAPQYRPPGPPVANVAPQIKPAQPITRPVNTQIRPPPQRAQVAPKPPAPAKCTGKECKR